MPEKQKFFLIRIVLLKILGRTLYEYFMGRIKLGYWPHIRHPRSFNEKILYRKTFAPHPMASFFADKYAVRLYVIERVGEKILNKIHFVGQTPEEIPFVSLPEKFVIKTNNGSGDNFFVRDKSRLSLEEVKAWHREVKKRQFGVVSNEPWYLAMEPKIMIEEFMEDGTHEVPLDFKFFCFNGTAVFVQVDFDRFQLHTRRFFNMDWTPCNFICGYALGQNIDKPDNLDELKRIAEKLAAGHDFLRVDLYLLNGEVRFGEITMTPGAGWEAFSPREADFKIGELWPLELTPLM